MPVLLGGAALTRQLCRGGLRRGLCLRPRRLCARCLRRAASDGQGDRQRLRRLPGRGRRRSAAGKARNTDAHAGPGRCARVPAGRCRRGARLRRAELHARRAGADAAVLGRARDRRRRRRRSCRSSTSAASTSSSGASASRAGRWTSSWAGRSQELRPVHAADAGDAARQQDILRPQAAYGYWKAAGRGQRPDPVRRRRHDASSRASPCRASRSEDGDCASPISSATSTTPSAT